MQRVFANWNVDVPSKLRHHGKRSVVANSAEREAVGQFNAVDIEFYQFSLAAVDLFDSFAERRNNRLCTADV